MSEKEQDDMHKKNEVLPASIREAIATMRGKKPSGEMAPQDFTDELFPVKAAMEKAKEEEAAKKEAAEKALKEALKHAKIGDYIEGKGIYCGKWVPKDRTGKSLGTIFNLFAAPEDIGILKSFNDAVKSVATLRNWHGHDGYDHEAGDRNPQEKLYDDLRSGNYKGEWFIPPKDVLEKLYKYKGFFKGDAAFKEPGSNSRSAHWYWSCTEHDASTVIAWYQRFDGGEQGFFSKKNQIEMSVRCVRAEPVPKL